MAFAINNFEYVLSLEFRKSGWLEISWDGVPGRILLSESGDLLVVEKESIVLLEIPLTNLLMELANNTKTNTYQTTHTAPEEMTFDFTDNNFRTRLILDDVTFKDKPGPPRVQTMSGLLFLGSFQSGGNKIQPPAKY